MDRRSRVLYIVLFLAVLAVMDMKYNASNLAAPFQTLVWSKDQQGFSIDHHTPSAGREGKVSEKLDPGEMLFVNNTFGSIEVSGSEADEQEAAIEYRITVYANTAEQAQAYLDKVGLAVARFREGVKVNLTEPDNRPGYIRGIKLNINAIVPAGARVALYNGFGLVRVRNVGGPSKVYNRFSETEIADVKGDWQVEARYSVLRVSNVDGDLQVTGDFGSNHIQDVTGNVTVRSNQKETQVQNIGGDLEADVRYGRLDLDHVEGAVTVNSAFTEVHGRDIGGDIDISTNYGDVDLGGVGGNIEVSSKYSDVSLELKKPLDYKFDLRVQYGDIKRGFGLRDLPGEKGDKDKKVMRGTVGAGSKTVNIRTSFGDIRLESM